MGEHVGALDCLGREAENVVDDEDGGGGGGGAGGVALGAVQVDVFAFFFVAFGDGGRDVAAGFAVALLCLHDWMEYLYDLVMSVDVNGGFYDFNGNDINIYRNIKTQLAGNLTNMTSSKTGNKDTRCTNVITRKLQLGTKYTDLYLRAAHLFPTESHDIPTMTLVKKLPIEIQAPSSDTKKSLFFFLWTLHYGPPDPLLALSNEPERFLKVVLNHRR